MTKEYFFKKMQELSTAYDKQLTKEKLQVYYEYLYQTPELIFDKVVARIIKEEDYFPRIKKFLEYILEEKEKEYKERQQFNNQNEAKCDLCNNSGMICFKYQGMGFSAYCKCSRGKILKEKHNNFFLKNSNKPVNVKFFQDLDQKIQKKAYIPTANIVPVQDDDYFDDDIPF